MNSLKIITCEKLIIRGTHKKGERTRYLSWGPALIMSSINVLYIFDSYITSFAQINSAKK